MAEIFVSREYFTEVNELIKNSGVKFLPYRKTKDGHIIRLSDHPILLFLRLKYDIMIQ